MVREFGKLDLEKMSELVPAASATLSLSLHSCHVAPPLFVTAVGVLLIIPCISDPDLTFHFV